MAEWLGVAGVERLAGEWVEMMAESWVVWKGWRSAVGRALVRVAMRVYTLQAV